MQLGTILIISGIYLIIVSIQIYLVIIDDKIELIMKDLGIVRKSFIRKVIDKLKGGD